MNKILQISPGLGVHLFADEALGRHVRALKFAGILECIDKNPGVSPRDLHLPCQR